MAPHLVRQRHDSGEVANRPAPGCKFRAVDHAAYHGEQEKVHPLEVAHDAVETDAESGFGEFLGGGRPFDAHAKEVAEDGFEKVEGDAAEE
jgi:hypothetical protein